MQVLVVARVELFLAVFPIVLTLLVNIAARRERPFARAGYDDAADIVVGGVGLQRVVQFYRQLPVHRIQHVRPVHCHDADAVLLFGQDVFIIAHRNSPFSSRSSQLTPRARYIG